LPRYDGRASPSTWLYAITRNTCLSARRYDALRRTRPLDEAHDAAARASEGPATGDASEAQRQVIRLFYLEERSLREVGLLLDMPEGTVKSHLHRARLALARAMNAQGAC
jgi:RNA polymerase sigma-70 factor (ECF subfamily)